MGESARRDRLVALLAPVVEAEGLDLEDVTVTPAGKRRLVRVVVDRDGGISLDDVSEVSRSVSDRLDATDALGGGPYVLEVTSPGVDRPLTEPRHWRRARGRLVKAALTDGTGVEGRILEADDDGVEIEAAGRFAYADLAKGKVQVEFRHLDDEDEDEEDIADGDEG
ncbi:ribosome maturation factor RimP [Herbidospora yilanensis]|uniref:ribosome maturation factor RimP n=1 Tax=Herbidospora yilanensis TaxID=354426 RepID=UPI0007826737|nr:ribosome maturation factor RimP [Herbidospora yilanensis]